MSWVQSVQRTMRRLTVATEWQPVLARNEVHTVYGGKASGIVMRRRLGDHIQYREATEDEKTEAGWDQSK